MPIIKFELKMTNIASWNGKWSGEKEQFVNFRNLSKGKILELLGGQNGTETKYYRHDWKDGWGCNVVVSRSNAKEKRKLKKHINFCGYEWMIENIIKHQNTKEPII